MINFQSKLFNQTHTSYPTQLSFIPMVQVVIFNFTVHSVGQTDSWFRGRGDQSFTTNELIIVPNNSYDNKQNSLR